MRKRVVLHGRVQGVFFRETIRREAERAGVAGSVRNNPDGTVEAVLEGNETAVERVLAACRRGPEGADVDRVEVREEAEEGLEGFSVE